MAATSWMKWFPSDWRSDPRVWACSFTARYVWFEMLMLMHESKPPGRLTLNGKAMQPDALANLIHVPRDIVTAALIELEASGVFSRKQRGGIIYSRRMEADEKRRRVNVEFGKLGGNPKLLKHKKKLERVNPSVYPRTRTRARSQIKEKTPKEKVNGTYPEDFETALASYGLNQAKQAALKHWRNLALEDRKAAVQAIPAFLKKHTDKNFRPYFRTYLSERRWEELAPSDRLADTSMWTDNNWVAAIAVATRIGKWPPEYGPPDRIPAHLIDDGLRSILETKKRFDNAGEKPAARSTFDGTPNSSVST